MKTQLISDTHGKHHDLELDLSCDLIVHAGDSTNYYEVYKNEIEFRDFINWYACLPIKHKILIAGNHDAYATKRYNRDICKELGIIYLEDDYVEIEGKTIFGSPWSPTFGNWYFMKNRSKLGTFWDNLLMEDIDLLVTHTPPKGVLDLSYNRQGTLEFCGCSGLRKAVSKYRPRHHVFGHIHNCDDIVNFGTRIIEDTEFHNVSAVKDGEFHKGAQNKKGIIINL